ncbi:YidH family protein [Pontibacter beigongshangensis]|uniref:YidH family protein n=1 Tax=Pontibacter beigongshangensis TaxID=2574733 RepID=UPI00164FCE8F|nr:DUF202 domain-containing protein [Pontibacter beigongshangensis]
MADHAKKEIKKLRKKLKVQEKKNTEIRDRMAMERTIFANERTLMAYLRTSLATMAGGFAAIKLSNDLYLKITGFMLLPVGIILAIYAFYRYRQKQKTITTHHEAYIPTSHHHASLHEKEVAGYGNID